MRWMTEIWWTNPQAKCSMFAVHGLDIREVSPPRNLTSQWAIICKLPMVGDLTVLSAHEVSWGVYFALKHGLLIVQPKARQLAKKCLRWTQISTILVNHDIYIYIHIGIYWYIIMLNLRIAWHFNHVFVYPLTVPHHAPLYRLGSGEVNNRLQLWELQGSSLVEAGSWPVRWRLVGWCMLSMHLCIYINIYIYLNIYIYVYYVCIYIFHYLFI